MFDMNNVNRDIELFILELVNKIELSLKQELIESFVEDNKYLDFIVVELEDLNSD